GRRAVRLGDERPQSRRAAPRGDRREARAPRRLRSARRAVAPPAARARRRAPARAAALRGAGGRLRARSGRADRARGAGRAPLRPRTRDRRGARAARARAGAQRGARMTRPLDALTDGPAEVELMRRVRSGAMTRAELARCLPAFPPKIQI